jgi:hypothetical protein
MDAHEFVHFEVDFDLNNPYQSTDEEIVQMLSSQHPIIDEDEEDIITDDVVEVHMGFKDVVNALETLKKFLEQRPNEVMPFIKNVQTLEKQVKAWRVEESHQTTIDSFFQRA